MPIESRVYWPAHLTVHEVYGGVSRKEFGETIRSFYKDTGPTKNVLWDIRKVAWDMVSARDVLDTIAEGMRIYHEDLGARQGGRTAVVVTDGVGLGFATLSQMLLDAYKPPLPFEIEVFSDTTTANYWLQHGSETCEKKLFTTPDACS